MPRRTSATPTPPSWPTLSQRFKRMQGYEAVLTTGSDEHGVNVERAAERAGKTPKEFCDVIAAEFARQWQMLGLQIDHFQRTTRPATRARGAGSVRALPARTATSIRAPTPASTASSTTSTSTTPSPATPAPIAAGPPKPSPKRISSSSCRRSRTGCWSSTRRSPDFIQPETRRNEVISFVQGGLERPFHHPHQHQVGHPGATAKRRTCFTCGSTRSPLT